MGKTVFKRDGVEVSFGDMEKLRHGLRGAASDMGISLCNGTPCLIHNPEGFAKAFGYETVEVEDEKPVEEWVEIHAALVWSALMSGRVVRADGVPYRVVAGSLISDSSGHTLKGDTLFKAEQWYVLAEGEDDE